MKGKPKETKLESRIQEPEFCILDSKEDFALPNSTNSRGLRRRLPTEGGLMPLLSAQANGIQHSELEGSSSLPTPDSQLNNYIQMARKYADAGEYDRAGDLCRKALAVDVAAVKPYFLLAHIAEIKGNNEEAISLLKKVIYLDPAFAAAYIELGALYERGNIIAPAKKMRAAAMELVRVMPPDAPVEAYEGVTAKELLEYLHKIMDNR